MQCEFQAEVVGGRHSISSLFLSISLSHFYTLELVHTRWFVFFPGVQMLTVIVLRYTDGTWSLAGGEQTNLHEHTWKLMGKRNAVVCIWFWWPRGICFLFFTFHILLELLEVLNVPLNLGGCTIWPWFSYDLEMIPCRVKDRGEAEQERTARVFMDCSSFRMSVMNGNHLQTKVSVYGLNHSCTAENMMVLGLYKSHVRDYLSRIELSWREG